MYCSPNIIRVIKSRRFRLTGPVGRMEEGKRPLGRPRHRWEDNIRMDKEIDLNTRIGLIWLRIGIIGEPM